MLDILTGHPGKPEDEYLGLSLLELHVTHEVEAHTEKVKKLEEAIKTDPSLQGKLEKAQRKLTRAQNLFAALQMHFGLLSKGASRLDDLGVAVSVQIRRRSISPNELRQKVDEALAIDLEQRFINTHGGMTSEEWGRKQEGTCQPPEPKSHLWRGRRLNIPDV